MTAVTRSDLPEGYGSFVEALKARIRDAQIKAALAVNRELLTLYWNIGREIVERQGTEGWGGRVLERLADDLQRAFPAVAGFSRTNVYRMRAFYLAYPSKVGGSEVVPQLVGQLAQTLPATIADLPWGHHAVLLERVKEPTVREWYAREASAHGWSRAHACPDSVGRA